MASDQLEDNQSEKYGILNSYNFRRLYPFLDEHGQDKVSGVLYRSSQLHVNKPDVKSVLDTVGVNTIVHFGNVARGEAGIFSQREVIVTGNERYQPGEQVTTKSHLVGSDDRKTVYSISSGSVMKLAKSFISKVPWICRPLVYLVVLLDWMLGTKPKYFLRFAYFVLKLVGGLPRLYQYLLDKSHREICAALKLMSDPKHHPAVITCSIGKDRTGLVSALLLHCLGKPRDYIIQEWSLSKEFMENLPPDCGAADLIKAVGEGWADPLLKVEPEAMVTTFQYIDKEYGSVDEYLEYIGFTKDDQRKLRQSVLGSTATD